MTAAGLPLHVPIPFVNLGHFETNFFGESNYFIFGPIGVLFELIQQNLVLTFILTETLLIGAFSRDCRLEAIWNPRLWQQTCFWRLLWGKQTGINQVLAWTFCWFLWLFRNRPWSRLLVCLWHCLWLFILKGLHHLLTCLDLWWVLTVLHFHVVIFIMHKLSFF